ncbi:MAG: mechanosensitive ion channel protein MscS [Cyclobacteriaceae bacterium]|nr:MAG: mechanosensitive ion channel protein MscS [Cyclobacteriaceae bacterium]
MKFTDNPYLDYLIFSLGVLFVAWIISRIFKAIITRSIAKFSTDLKLDPTKFYFFRNAINAILLITSLIIIFYSIPELKHVGISLFAGAGILAAVIGFASQHAFSNIVGGIFLVLFKPFKVGDVINVGTYFGVVEDITLRHTVINGMENRRIVIPNSTISTETILNSSLFDDKVCIFLQIGISYDSSIDHAFEIMVDEATKHPAFIDNRTEQEKTEGKPAVITRVLGFGDSSVNLRAQVWAADPIIGFSMKCDLFKSIKERFDKEGIEIPFPYRTIVYKQKKADGEA